MDARSRLGTGLVATAVVLAVTAACGDVVPGSGTDPGARPDHGFGDPPPLTLRLPDGDAPLEPWTYCLEDGCSDGWRGEPAQVMSVGSPRAVDFTFPWEGWQFEATFLEGDGPCTRQVTMPVERTGARSFRISPVGPADSWIVDVFGRGPEGDVITSFRWRTPREGAYPDEASGSLGVLAEHDGRLDSYGVELSVQDLARTPREATAEVEVIAEDGRRVTIVPRRQQCHSAGSVGFTAPDDVGRRAAGLPGDRFEYVVRLALDGTTYTGTGTWPDDTDEEITPSVPLEWSPALPVYASVE